MFEAPVFKSRLKRSKRHLTKPSLICSKVCHFLRDLANIQHQISHDPCTLLILMILVLLLKRAVFKMYSVIIFEHGMQHICLRLSIWLHVCSGKMAPRCDLLGDSCVGQQLGLSARSQEMGSTEIVVLFPITDPPPFCGSQKLQKFHNPSQPQPSTLQNQPERSCTTSATNRSQLSPLSTPESTASFPATPVAQEPPVRPAVPALQRARRGASGGRKGHGGIFRSFLWGSDFSSDLLHLPSSLPVLPL